MIAFGDSSGKGAAAALYGAVVDGLLRTLAPRRRAPAALMKALNDALVERKVEARYVSLLVMSWHPHSGEFVMANAGAIPPMVCRSGEMLKLRVEGVPLGLLPDRDYEEIALKTKPADMIVLYSDGITDHLGAAGEEYGRGRLATVVRSTCHLSPKEVIDAVFEDLDRFNLQAFDDQTMVVVQVK